MWHIIEVHDPTVALARVCSCLCAPPPFNVAAAAYVAVGVALEMPATYACGSEQ